MSSEKFLTENGIMSGPKKVFDVGNADLGKLFLETLKSKPDFVGQVDPITGEESTYGQMMDKSIRCALWLRKKGLKPGDIVFVCSYNQMSSYIPILATFYNAAVFIYGHKETHLQNIRHLFNLLKPKFIFADEGEAEVFLKATKEENLDTNIVVFTKLPGFDSLNEILCQSKLKEVDEFCCLQPSNPNDDCLLAFSSGTTGESKIIVHSYKSYMEALLLFTSNKQQNEIVSIIYWPLSWLAALSRMLSDILKFMKRIVVNETSYDLHEAFQLIEKYKVTNVCFSIGMIYRMYKWNKLDMYDTSSLEKITLAGAKIRPEILKFLTQMTKNGNVVQVYGSTETLTSITLGIMNNIDLKSCGYLWLNVSMKVIDVQTGTILGPREEGEICIKTPYLMKGYFKNEKATKEAFDSEGWYHTGDIGYYDESGLVYILGRVKDTLMVQNGKIISLWEVYRALYLNSEVIEAVILPGSQLSDQSRVFVFVTLIPGSKVTEDELAEVGCNLSNIKVPITVKILDQLPLTPRGKVKLSELKNIAENAIKNNL